MGQQEKLFHLWHESKEPIRDPNGTKLCCCGNGNIQHRKGTSAGLHQCWTWLQTRRKVQSWFLRSDGPLPKYRICHEREAVPSSKSGAVFWTVIRTKPDTVTETTFCGVSGSISRHLAEQGDSNILWGRASEIRSRKQASAFPWDPIQYQSFPETANTKINGTSLETNLLIYLALNDVFSSLNSTF